MKSVIGLKFPAVYESMTGHQKTWLQKDRAAVESSCFIHEQEAESMLAKKGALKFQSLNPIETFLKYNL